jgi:ERO1-like protein alpha
MICNFHTCAVCQCEENEIPLPWKQDSENDDVDKKIDEKFYQWIEKYNYSSNQWLVETEIDAKKGIYVNLEKNPEAFTGYQGQHIWNAIYQENCFSGPFDQMCLEEKIFYKIISGLHSNINLHLSKNYIEIDKNITYFNHSMMAERLLNYKDRVNNLFFLHAVLINSFYQAKATFAKFDIYTGNKSEDAQTQKSLKELLDLDHISDKYSKGFSNSDNIKKFLRSHKIDEIKMRFRNISSIIDCVSCQKCKLHGKLQIYGLATMLKIMFSNEENLKLKRNEFISFVNFVGKVSKSISYLTEYLDILREDAERFKGIYFTFIAVVLLFMIYLNYQYLTNREKYDQRYRKNKWAEKEFYAEMQKVSKSELLNRANIIIDNKKER